MGSTTDWFTPTYRDKISATRSTLCRHLHLKIIQSHPLFSLSSLVEKTTTGSGGSRGCDERRHPRAPSTSTTAGSSPIAASAHARASARPSVEPRRGKAAPLSDASVSSAARSDAASARPAAQEEGRAPVQASSSPICRPQSPLEPGGKPSLEEFLPLQSEIHLVPQRRGPSRHQPPTLPFPQHPDADPRAQDGLLVGQQAIEESWPNPSSVVSHHGSGRGSLQAGAGCSRAAESGRPASVRHGCAPPVPRWRNKNSGPSSSPRADPGIRPTHGLHASLVPAAPTLPVRYSASDSGSPCGLPADGGAAPRRVVLGGLSRAFGDAGPGGRSRKWRHWRRSRCSLVALLAVMASRSSSVRRWCPSNLGFLFFYLCPFSSALRLSQL